MDTKPKRVVAIVGTYRKGGIIDSTVDEILASVKEEGAIATKVYLIDQYIEFCANCRNCTQERGEKRGECVKADDMKELLDEIDQSDALVLASPMNCGTVTAVTKRFIERLLCYAYWPWGTAAPKVRITHKNKSAIVVASSAAPAVTARFQGGMIRLMKLAANYLGAKTRGVLFVGLSAMEKHQRISDRTRRKAHAMGKRLVAGT